MTIEFVNGMMRRLATTGAIAVLALGAMMQKDLGVAQQPVPHSQVTSPPLIGRWKGTIKTPLSEEMVEITFSETGQMVFLSRSISDMLSAFPFRYTVDVKPKPMHLDLMWSANKKDQQIARTIFELTADDKLKLQIEGTEAGKPRPRSFSNEMLLSRISGNLSESLSAAEKAKDGEGLVVMSALVRSAMIQNLQQNKFATTLADLGLSSDTANYRYQLETQSNRLRIVARPKRQGLKSYSAIVARYTNDQNTPIALAKLCRSFRPSLLAPATPSVYQNRDFSAAMFSGIKCAPGSESVPS